MPATLTTFNCTSATYDDLVFSIGNIWSDAPIKEKQDYPGVAAQKVFNGHGMRVVNEVMEGGKCVGWKAVWLTNCADETAARSGTSFPAAVVCDIPVGVDPTCEEVAYDVNLFVDKATSYSDQSCTIRFTGVEQAALQLNKAMMAVREGISIAIMDLVMANMTPNTWAGSRGTVVGTWTEFTADEFDINLLYHIRQIARKHNCDDYAIIDDTNFSEIYDKLIDGQCCADGSGRSTFSRFDFSFDRWLNDYTTRNSTLLISPKNFGVLNTTRYMNTVPTQIKPADGENGALQGWYMEDPEFTILETQPNGAQTVRPIRYDVESKKVCGGRDSRGNLIFQNTYWVTFTGCITTAPTDCNNGLCNFEFVNTGAPVVV